MTLRVAAVPPLAPLPASLQTEPEGVRISSTPAAALKRAVGNEARFGALAAQIAAVLQQILASSANPCPDPIPAQYC